MNSTINFHPYQLKFVNETMFHHFRVKSKNAHYYSRKVFKIE